MNDYDYGSQWEVFLEPGPDIQFRYFTGMRYEVICPSVGQAAGTRFLSSSRCAEGLRLPWFLS